MVQFFQEGKQNIGFLIIEKEYQKQSPAIRSHLLQLHHTICFAHICKHTTALPPGAEIESSSNKTSIFPTLGKILWFQIKIYFHFQKGTFISTEITPQWSDEAVIVASQSMRDWAEEMYCQVHFSLLLVWCFQWNVYFNQKVTLAGNTHLISHAFRK